MRTLTCLLLALITPVLSAVDLVVTNDDWPIETKDDLNTFDAKLEDSDWFIQYRMLTNWRNRDMVDWQRVDEIEGGLLFRRMFNKLPNDLPIGVAVLMQGDFNGQSMQQSMHKMTGGKPTSMPYDDSVSRIGLWFHQRIESDIGDWKIDGKFYEDRVSARLDYSHTCTIQGYELTAGAFGRFSYENTEHRTSQEVNDQLRGFGIYGQIVYNSAIFSVSMAINDVRGGIGWRF